jgi:ParB family chromosome partitioning protein
MADNPTKGKPLGKGLGRGLSALLAAESLSVDMRDAIIRLSINDLNPNVDQPRKHFDKDRLQELAESIKQNGVIQPIIVTHSETGYKIVAGERRWRAARMAGLKEIPAIVRELTDVQVLEQALIENIQRQDLNPIEEALALDRLMRDHAMTQERLAAMIGRSRPAIANNIRLLQLSEPFRQMVIDEVLTAGHARALLSLPSEEIRGVAARNIVAKALSVRQTEALVKTLLRSPKKATKADSDQAYAISVRDLEHRLQSCLGTKVQIQDRKSKGRIVIDYYSYDDLDRILERIGLPGEK